MSRSNVTVTAAGGGPVLPPAGVVETTSGSRQYWIAWWVSGTPGLPQSVAVSSTSIFWVMPPSTVTLRLFVPVIEPQSSTVSQLPRVYLYWMSVPSRTVTVASQMPLPRLVIACFAGSHGPSWSMLPGTYNVASGGVPGGASTRNVTATGRIGTVSDAGRVAVLPSGFVYARWATTLAVRGAAPVGV